MAAAAIPGALTARRHAVRHNSGLSPKSDAAPSSMSAETQASICLLGPWRAKEIVEFVHQPA
jgi:hypothetical protein